MQPDDILIVTELSRFGRSLLEVMSILHTLMEKEVKVFTTKERYELGNNISSKVLAFAFSLSAEIERSMISSRTKEALARKKSEGKRLGRPKGKLSAVTKLTGKDDLIQEYLEKKNPPKCHCPALKREPADSPTLHPHPQTSEARLSAIVRKAVLLLSPAQPI